MITGPLLRPNPGPATKHTIVLQAIMANKHVVMYIIEEEGLLRVFGAYSIISNFSNPSQPGEDEAWPSHL
jgi:hypothetical protein